MALIEARGPPRKEHYRIFKTLRAVSGNDPYCIALTRRLTLIKVALASRKLIDVADEVVKPLERARLKLSRMLVKKHKVVLALLLARRKSQKTRLVIQLHQ